MIKNIGNVSVIKENIQNLKDQSVKVTVNLGRNRIESFFGTISQVYPALFTVMPFDKNYKGKTSYSYSEYLCGKVKVNKADL